MRNYDILDGQKSSDGFGRAPKNAMACEPRKILGKFGVVRIGSNPQDTYM